MHISSSQIANSIAQQTIQSIYNSSIHLTQKSFAQIHFTFHISPKTNLLRAKVKLIEFEKQEEEEEEEKHRTQENWRVDRVDCHAVSFYRYFIDSIRFNHTKLMPYTLHKHTRCLWYIKPIKNNSHQLPFFCSLSLSFHAFTLFQAAFPFFNDFFLSYYLFILLLPLLLISPHSSFVFHFVRFFFG